MKNPVEKSSAKFLSLITYAQQDDVEALLRAKSSQIRYASLAYHDQDKKDDGTPKVPHLHINLLLHCARKIDDIMSWFSDFTDKNGKRVNTRYEHTINTKGAEDYLIHDTDEAKKAGKYQYDKEIKKVLMGDTDDYVSQQTDIELYRQQKAVKAQEAITNREFLADDVEAQLQDIIDRVPYREMARRYGRDYIKNRKAYTEYALMMHVEETGEIPDHLMNDPLQVLINTKVRQATEYTAEKVATAYEVLYNKACDEIGLAENVTRQIAIKIQKYLQGD